MGAFDYILGYDWEQLLHSCCHWSTTSFLVVCILSFYLLTGCYNKCYKSSEVFLAEMFLGKMKF